MGRSEDAPRGDEDGDGDETGADDERDDAGATDCDDAGGTECDDAGATDCDDAGATDCDDAGGTECGAVDGVGDEGGSDDGGIVRGDEGGSDDGGDDERGGSDCGLPERVSFERDTSASESHSSASPPRQSLKLRVPRGCSAWTACSANTPSSMTLPKGCDASSTRT